MKRHVDSDFLKEFDFFSKIDKSGLKSTTSGGVLTWIALAFIAILFLFELWAFLTPSFNEIVSIDHSDVKSMNIFFDVIFPQAPCNDMIFRGMTQFGVQPESFSLISVYYSESTPDLVYCKKCPQPNCCSCDEFQKQARELTNFYVSNGLNIPTCHYIESNSESQGCRLFSKLKMAKLKGMFFFSLVESWSLVNPRSSKLSHQIILMSFGDYFPGIKNQLNGHKETFVDDPKHWIIHTYSVQIIPTVYDDESWDPTYSHQYSVSAHTEKSVNPGFNSNPGVFINYDLSPMLISIIEVPKSFFHLLTRLCAVIGGTWIIFGLLNSLLMRKY